MSVLQNHGEAVRELQRVMDENEKLREFVTWVDTWVSNPVTGYSINALDGIFGMTRDRIAALRPFCHGTTGERQ